MRASWGSMLAGVVGGADQGGAQQRRPGLGHRLAFAVGVAGLGGPGDSPVKERNCLPRREPGRVAHGGDQGGAADLGDAGQGAGEPGGVDPPVAGLAFGGVGGELGLDGAQQADLGGDLGGQVGERDRRVAGVELERRLGGGRSTRRPGRRLGGSLEALAITAVSRLTPSLSRAFGSAQRSSTARSATPRSPVSGVIGSSWRTRSLIRTLCSAPAWVSRSRGPDPPIQRRPLGAGQLQRLQPGRVEQRQPGQGVGVDAVGLGVPGQEPAQIRRLGRRHPVHQMPAAGEEHRDRQPRRPGRLDDHLQPGARPGTRPTPPPRPRRGSPRSATPCVSRPCCPASSSTRTVCALAMPRSIPTRRLIVHLVSLRSCRFTPARPQERRTIRPRSQGRHAPTAAPTHVLQPAPTSTGRATSLIRGIRGQPGVAIRSNGARPIRDLPRAELDATPRTSRDDHATLGPRCDQVPMSLT